MIGEENTKILGDILKNKNSREIIIKLFIKENKLLTDIVINYFNLQRITNKYITKTRAYNENSYSKKQIRKEEQIYLETMMLYQPMRFYFEEQNYIIKNLKISESRYHNSAVDDKLYSENLLYNKINFKTPEDPLSFKHNNHIRIDKNLELYDIIIIRENSIKLYITNFQELSNFIINNFDLKFLVYKYINFTINNDETSYTRAKIKEQEIFFLKKAFQYCIWAKRMIHYMSLQKALHNNEDFLIYYVNYLIKYYKKDNFHISDNVGL